MMNHRKLGYLILEDGRRYNGILYGEHSGTCGEVVFNTAMSGYQEVLYDPSYWGQIVIMTAAHIGNTGVNHEDDESGKPYLSGFAARSFNNHSNWRSEKSLYDFLNDYKIQAISELDTRAITRHLRQVGAMRGGIFKGAIAIEAALDTVLNHTSMNGLDGASRVSCLQAYDWNNSYSNYRQSIHVDPPFHSPLSKGGYRGDLHKVAVIDYGVKYNMLRILTDLNCRIRVFPSSVNISEIEQYKPDGILLSNGPGDPAAVVGAPEKIQYFLGKIPIFGICLGHQLLALACGGKTYKMKFGHRGINHPVSENANGQVIVSVHNHGFAVTDDPLPNGSHVTLRSLNDNTIEGLDYPNQKAFSVQFHPEASPGPHDAFNLFHKFIQLMESHACKK